MNCRLGICIPAILAVCLVVLGGGPVFANPDPPSWDQLRSDQGYGHVQYTYDSLTHMYSFAVYNDMSANGAKITGFVVYPESKLYGNVPIEDRPVPTGWKIIGWSGTTTSLVSTFGDTSYGFDSTSTYSALDCGESMDDFSFRWSGAEAPSRLAFGVAVKDRTGSTFWAQCAGITNSSPAPVPDANSLVLLGTAAVVILPSLIRGRRRRAV